MLHICYVLAVMGITPGLLMRSMASLYNHQRRCVLFASFTIGLLANSGKQLHTLRIFWPRGFSLSGAGRFFLLKLMA
jgi:hypothetical protein